MTDLRCKCGAKLAEYNNNEVRIMDRKCKAVTVLRIVDGKLRIIDEHQVKRVVEIIVDTSWIIKKFNDGTEECELNTY